MKPPPDLDPAYYRGLQDPPPWWEPEAPVPDTILRHDILTLLGKLQDRQAALVRALMHGEQRSKAQANLGTSKAAADRDLALARALIRALLPTD